MARELRVRGVFRAALGVVVLASLVAAEESEAPGHYTVPLAMEPLEREVIPLENAHVIIPQGRDGAPRQVKVALRKTWYDCTLLEVNPEGSRVRRTGLWCYELDAKSAYTWSTWRLGDAVNFRLFAHGPGENYLAWIEGGLVVIAEVTEPQDRCLSLAQRPLLRENEGLMVVAVPLLVPRSRAWGGNALYLDIRVKSFRKLPDGTFEMRITDPEGTESYTLVGQGYEWRLAESTEQPAPTAAPAENPPAPEPVEPASARE
jgi:hypothetical protein